MKVHRAFQCKISVYGSEWLWLLHKFVHFQIVIWWWGHLHSVQDRVQGRMVLAKRLQMGSDAITDNGASWLPYFIRKDSKSRLRQFSSRYISHHTQTHALPADIICEHLRIGGKEVLLFWWGREHVKKESTSLDSWQENALSFVREKRKHRPIQQKMWQTFGSYCQTRS